MFLLAMVMDPEADPDPPDSPVSDCFYRFFLSPSPVDVILPVLLTPEERVVLSLLTFAFQAPGPEQTPGFSICADVLKKTQKKPKTKPAINSNYS